MKNTGACIAVDEELIQGNALMHELEKKECEIKRLRAELAAVEKDRDALRGAADGDRDEKQLQGCLGACRTGLIRAMRDAFA